LADTLVHPMTKKVPDKLAAADLSGFKYFRMLQPLLQRLHDAGTARDRAGNRSLHFDQYCTLVLLALFNPLVRSLRGMQQASELAKVQARLGVKRTSLGSLSESSHVFDPDLLLPIIQELAGQLRPVAHDPRLKEIRQVLTAVDGTLVKALPRLAEAMWLKTKDGQPQHAWRLHTHFDVVRGVPVRMERSDARNKGASNEKAVLRRRLQPDHCYVFDRLYAQFTLYNDIVAARSSYVGRLRDNSSFEVVEERPLSAEARAAGIVRDAVVRLGMTSKAKKRPNHLVRVVVVAVRPHQKRGGRKGKTAGPASTGLLLIATNLVDVPAEIVALVYRYRWTIEIFFRFFKHVLGCRHLFSAYPNGIAIQTYCALIGCMLINLWTGRKPTLRTYEMLGWYFLGWATLAEVEAHLAKLARPPPPRQR
jgi:Transposase DDE domain